MIAVPAYQSRSLYNSPSVAQQDPGGAQGVFFGYDFHVSSDVIGLIEINTSAGRAMFYAYVARAQRVR